MNVANKTFIRKILFFVKCCASILTIWTQSLSDRMQSASVSNIIRVHFKASGNEKLSNIFHMKLFQSFCYSYRKSTSVEISLWLRLKSPKIPTWPKETRNPMDIRRVRAAQTKKAMHDALRLGSYCFVNLWQRQFRPCWSLVKGGRFLCVYVCSGKLFPTQGKTNTLGGDFLAVILPL